MITHSNYYSTHANYYSTHAIVMMLLHTYTQQQQQQQQTIATWVSQNNVPQAVVEYGSDAVFLLLFAGVAYSVIATAAGQTPDKLPFISGVVQKRLDRYAINTFFYY
jgi:hypothetical protein